MEWVDSPDEHADSINSDSDEAVREIARHLDPTERAKFLRAINHIRDQAGKGKVYLKQPNERQQLVLDTYEQCDHNARVVHERTGIPLATVYHVLRTFDAKPIQHRIKDTGDITEFTRKLIEQGYTREQLRKPLTLRLKLRQPLSNWRLDRIIHSTGMKTVDARKKIGKEDWPELLAAVDNLARVYNVKPYTIINNMMRALSARTSKERGAIDGRY